MSWLQKTQDETGQVVIIFGALLLLLAVGGVMVVDIGGALATRAEYRRTADLVALAAVADLPDTTQAQTSADAALLANDFDPADPGLASFISFPAADQIEVRVEGKRSLSFGAIFGLPDWNVTATAVAELKSIPLPYSIMAMNPSACGSLLSAGGAQINVTSGGGTYTRSTCTPDAMRAEGSADIVTGFNAVRGGAFEQGGGATISPTAFEGVEWINDPFDDLVQPVPAGACYAGPYSIGGGAVSLSPGRYCTKLEVSANAQVTLLPGIYFFEDGLNVDGQGTFSSGVNEVLLFNTCPTSPCNGVVPANMRFAGQADTTMYGHSSYRNIVIWFDRTAGPGAELIMQGGSAEGITGVIYAQSSKVNIAGNAGTTLNLNASIVADTVDLSGKGTINLDYDISTAPTALEPVLVK